MPSFFDNLSRIADPDYLPTNDDILRARVTTTGIIETRFDMGNLSIQYLPTTIDPSIPPLSVFFFQSWLTIA
jgi:hypothetical protein